MAGTPEELADILERGTKAIVDELRAAGRENPQVISVVFDGLTRSLVSANMGRDAMLMGLGLAIAHVVAGPAVPLTVDFPPDEPTEPQKRPM